MKISPVKTWKFNFIMKQPLKHIRTLSGIWDMHGISHSGGGEFPPSHDFFWKPSIRTNDSHPPPLKNEASPNWKTTPPPHWKWNLLLGNDSYKKTPKNQRLIFTHKKTLEKDSTKTWFSCLEHSEFRKKSETIRKYYIIWLIDLANKLYDVEKFLISFWGMFY